MSWRNILVASPAKLSLAQQHLHIAIGDEEIDVPLEDISVIIIENLQTLLTGQIISELAQRGIGVIICDERHLPCGELLPFHQHSRMRKALSFQLEMTEPFRKNSRLRRFFRENKDFEKRNAVFMGIQKTRKPEIEM